MTRSVLAVLRDKWQDVRRDLDATATREDPVRVDLHGLLDEVKNAGASETDPAKRAQLQLLAREIADRIFWDTRKYPDAIILPCDEGAGFRDSYVDVASLTAQFQNRVRADWLSRWARQASSEHMESRGVRELPPFVATQTMLLLQEVGMPQRFLRAENFRAGRPVSATINEVDRDKWTVVDRNEVAANRVTIAGAPCDLSRLVITADAGVGKTVTMGWLAAFLSEPASPTVPFYLTFRDLSSDILSEVLLPRFFQSSGSPCAAADLGVLRNAALRLLTQLRADGHVVLLIDALDQAPPDGRSLGVLRALLEDLDWRQTRIVVSGRPYALQRHWAELFDTGRGFGWRFLQLVEFDEAEQLSFLGRERFDRVPKEARDVLSTPRVLEYLRSLPDSDLGRIRTAGDVYWHSANHLLKEGMRNSHQARLMGLAADEPAPGAVQVRSLRRARKLLGGIAWQMASTLIRPATASGDGPVPNFEGVPPGQFDAFEQALFVRLQDASLPLLKRDIDSLAALNDFVAHGFFDTDMVGLDSVFWRNRTLQEFFAAYWLAQHCTAEDAQRLWEWLYVPEQPATEEYYWVWRFLCEMHQDARDPEAWSRAIEPIYRPGDCTGEGTKRSGELIYRAWAPLQELVRQGQAGPVEIQSRFLSEFEQVFLAGKRGKAAQQTAQHFVDSLLDVPAGEFRMGAPPEKQRMSEDVRSDWKQYLNQDGDPAERAAAHVASWSFPPSKQGQEWRSWEVQWWTDVFRKKDLDAVVRRWYPSDQTPAQPIQQVAEFCLSRWPTINTWYRLFDPSHGTIDSCYPTDYARMSPTSESPVIFVTWYEAWAFCLWTRWDGRSCRLPHEHEWEYAAKGGTAWDQNYWWGDAFDPEKCNAARRLGYATVPSEIHANPWGFVDILGNVLEWSDDEYRVKYDRDHPADRSDRVLRGGAWDKPESYARTAFRYAKKPTFSYYNIGFRVARDRP